MKGKITFCVLLLMLCCALSTAQTKVDLRSQSKSVDFGDSASTRPVKVGTTLPSICTTGELFFRSSASAGNNLYGCTATNIWTLLSSGGNVFGAASSTTGQMAVFTDTTGKQLGPYAGSGALKAQSGVVSAVTGNASDCVRVDGSSGGCVIPDPVTGVVTVAAAINAPAITAPAGTAFSASGEESAIPIAAALDTLFFSSTAHVPQFTRSASSSVDATMVVPRDCGSQFVKTVGADGTVTCAAGGSAGKLTATFLLCAGPCTPNETSNWRWTAPFAITFTGCTVDAMTYPTGAAVTVDVLKGGAASIFSSTVPTLAAGGTTFNTQTGMSAAAALTAGNYLIAKVLTAGSTVAGQFVNVVCTATY